MAGYQTIEALRPILHRGPPPTPVLDRSLFYKPRFKRSPTAQQIRRMVEMRQQGIPALRIGEEVGLSESTVFRYTKHVAPPETGWFRGGVQSRINREKAERMRRAGFTYAEIGEEFGVDRETARCFLKRIKRRSTAATSARPSTVKWWCRASPGLSGRRSFAAASVVAGLASAWPAPG